jgi:hypothetical protein
MTKGRAANGNGEFDMTKKRAADRGKLGMTIKILEMTDRAMGVDRLIENELISILFFLERSSL